MPVVVQLNFNGVAAQVVQRASAVVQKTAMDLEARAKQIVPVDTGLLKSSIQHQRVDDLTAQVDVFAEYAGYVEFGTSRQRAQPYLIPAAESVRPGFEAAMTQITR